MWIVIVMPEKLLVVFMSAYIFLGSLNPSKSFMGLKPPDA